MRQLNLNPAEQAWLALQRDKEIERGPNPCVRSFGIGPKGAKCSTCCQIFVSHDSGTRRYYKCELRKNTKGAATDHRTRWDACAKYSQVVKRG